MYAFFATVVAVVAAGYYYRASKKNQAMAINTNLPIRLTSKAIVPTEDGHYTFDQMSFLFAHEPLRREMDRGKAALEKMDISVHPWKVHYLRVWLEEFFIPIIKDHHDSEEYFFSPAYEKLGVVIPEKFQHDHDALMNALGEIHAAVQQLGQNTQDAASKLQDIRSKYFSMYTLLSDHLADEERFWPDVVRQQGEAVYKEVHNALHKAAKTQKSAKNFLMSVLDSMGYEFDPAEPTHLPGETRWCGNKLLEDTIINKIPFFVRAWIFPPYNRKYQYYKKLITAVEKGTEDTLPLSFQDSSKCVLC